MKCFVSVQVNELVIQTTESACQSFFLKVMLEAKIPILFVGPTGTGKSAIVNNHLTSLPRDTFLYSVVNFSARTSANQAQETIMSKLDRYFTLSAFDKYYMSIIGAHGIVVVKALQTGRSQV
jgi:Cdc6-like AAA superfamily ATPase